MWIYCWYESQRIIRQEKISDRQALEFRMECKKFFLKLAKKLMDKCPLKYQLMRSLTCLDPALICKDNERAISRFRMVLQSLAKAKRVQTEDVDDLLLEFSTFVEPGNYKLFENLTHMCQLENCTLSS